MTNVMKKVDPRIRISAYIAIMAVGGALVAWEVIDGVTLESLSTLLGGVLMVSGGGLATANTDVKARTKAPTVQEWALMGRDAIPAIFDELARLRDDVNRRNSDDAAPAALPSAGTGGVVPEAAPWLDGADYVGQHRIE